MPRRATSLGDGTDAFARDVLGGLPGAETLVAIHDVRKPSGPHRAVHPRAALARNTLHVLHAEDELVAKKRENDVTARVGASAIAAALLMLAPDLSSELDMDQDKRLLRGDIHRKSPTAFVPVSRAVALASVS